MRKFIHCVFVQCEWKLAARNYSYVGQMDAHVLTCAGVEKLICPWQMPTGTQVDLKYAPFDGAYTLEKFTKIIHRPIDFFWCKHDVQPLLLTVEKLGETVLCCASMALLVCHTRLDTIHRCKRSIDFEPSPSRFFFSQSRTNISFQRDTILKV